MKKNILFVNDEMEMGGVSRVLINLLANLNYDKYNVDLLVLHPHGAMLNQIPKQVNLIRGTDYFEVCDLKLKACFKKSFGLGLKKLSFQHSLKNGAIFDNIIKERKKMQLKHYEVEIAFKDGFTTFFTACGNSDYKINWIHADYKIKNYARHYPTSQKRALARFDRHIAVSKVAAKSYQNTFNLEKVESIHNVITDQIIRDKANLEVDYQPEADLVNLISVGRLHPQKAYDRLLRVCSRLNLDGLKYRLDIIGDGELREELLKQKQELKLDNVNFLLQKDNPFPYVKKADLFVLGSLYEGLATVVFESLILHTPLIACQVAGIDEQVNENNSLVVANDEEGLYQGLKYLITHPEKIREYHNNLKDYRYHNEKIIKQVEDLLDFNAISYGD